MKDMRRMNERERFIEKIQRAKKSGEKKGTIFMWRGEDADGEFYGGVVLWRGKRVVVREFKSSTIRGLRSYLREYGIKPPERFIKSQFPVH